MQPVWVIEAGVYGDEVVPLQGEIRRQGMRVATLPYPALKKGAEVVIDDRPIGPSDCVIGYGTYPFARQIQLHHPWVPGAWCNPEKLDCATYYAYFGKFLLNQDYAILPGVEAIRRRDWIYSTFGVDDEVFARPTGCQKLFVGRRISNHSFASALAPTRYDPETLVVVASPRPIDREWRLVVVGDRVIAGSQYAIGGERSIEAGCPAEVQSFAAAMLAEVRWRPDPVFMLDVCESAGRLWLVELNGFSTSWLYRCDLAVVVSEVSPEGAREWTGTHRTG
jgi:ATP-grasp domain, R2K clade family 3